jgi:hypothetical protein
MTVRPIQSRIFQKRGECESPLLGERVWVREVVKLKFSGKGRKMPPRRGWGIFGLGFYKDVAPTALGKARQKFHLRSQRIAKVRPRIMQIKNKRQPPDEIVCKAKDKSGGRPNTLPNQTQQTDGPENFSDETYKRQQPATFGHTSDFKIKNPIEANDHAQTRKNLRVIVQGHSSKTEKPLGV